jgi:hypothetical protein
MCLTAIDRIDALLSDPPSHTFAQVSIFVGRKNHPERRRREAHLAMTRVGQRRRDTQKTGVGPPEQFLESLLNGHLVKAVEPTFANVSRHQLTNRLPNICFCR